MLRQQFKKSECRNPVMSVPRLLKVLAEAKAQA